MRAEISVAPTTPWTDDCIRGTMATKTMRQLVLLVALCMSCRVQAARGDKVLGGGGRQSHRKAQALSELIAARAHDGTPGSTPSAGKAVSRPPVASPVTGEPVPTPAEIPAGTISGTVASPVAELTNEVPPVTQYTNSTSGSITGRCTATIPVESSAVEPQLFAFNYELTVEPLSELGPIVGKLDLDIASALMQEFLTCDYGSSTDFQVQRVASQPSDVASDSCEGNSGGQCHLIDGAFVMDVFYLERRRLLADTLTDNTMVETVGGFLRKLLSDSSPLVGGDIISLRFIGFTNSNVGVSTFGGDVGIEPDTDTEVGGDSFSAATDGDRSVPEDDTKKLAGALTVVVAALAVMVVLALIISSRRRKRKHVPFDEDRGFGDKDGVGDTMDIIDETDEYQVHVLSDLRFDETKSGASQTDVDFASTPSWQRQSRQALRDLSCHRGVTDERSYKTEDTLAL